MPITRILVANRGEIARRIFRTAREMGIGTAAVYAGPDARMPFVREADVAVALGGTTSAQTYLDIDKLVAAAKRTGADAIHPGYGFLSEKAEFARAVIAAGLTWIGPSPEAIAAMGDKIAAKKLMAQAGVPVLPGAELTGTGEDDLLAAGLTTGYPLLVKAAAGGGGRGMRIVADETRLAAAVAAARREATAAFGDGTLFFERYVSRARHVEVQVLGDTHGNVVHLFERECSIQRRHQKVVEEAPSSAVDPALRARMGEVAVAAAKAVSYTGAGTVEFVLGEGGEFFFLEMNTRLQVEHPVTEAITGIDLVREQIRVARGEPLGYGQGDLALHGHAIEVRLYAENPAKDFLPAPGHIVTWDIPADPPCRVDSGVESGVTVSPSFDAMLAKVVVHAPTRDEAAHRLALVLERSRLHGLTTNRDFLVSTLRHPAFLAGDTTTHFIEEHNPARARIPDQAEVRTAAIAATLAARARRVAAARVLATLPPNWRNNRSVPQRVTYTGPGGEIAVEYTQDRDGTFTFAVNGAPVEATLIAVGGEALDLVVDGVRQRVTVSTVDDRTWVQGALGEVALTELPRFPAPQPLQVSGGYVAPMPGKVVQAAVAVGDQVKEGQLLLVLEAMKMEHRISCAAPGTVRELRATAGAQVDVGDVLIVIDADA